VALNDEEGAKGKGLFSEEQMGGRLRVADKYPVPQVAKRHGVSAQTLSGWRHAPDLAPGTREHPEALSVSCGRHQSRPAAAGQDRPGTPRGWADAWSAIVWPSMPGSMTFLVILLIAKHQCCAILPVVVLGEGL
jgi:hypothetical protein